MGHKPKQLLEGVERRYTWAFYRINEEQKQALHKQARMTADLWNALLEIDQKLRELKVWVFDKEKDGPCIFDLNGNIHILSLSNIMLRRQWLGQYSSYIAIPTNQVFVLPDGEPRTRLPSAYDRGYWITQFLKTNPEWRELSTWTLRETARYLDNAWKHHFTPKSKRIPGRKYGPPQFKGRWKHFSIPHICIPWAGLEKQGLPTSGSGCKIEKNPDHKRGWFITLKGIPGKIRATGRLPAILKHGPIKQRVSAKVNKWTNANVVYANNKWEISIGVKIDKRRHHAQEILRPMTIELGKIDCFATVNGVDITPHRFDQVLYFSDILTRLQSTLDLKYPRGKRLTYDEIVDLNKRKREIKRLTTKLTRLRRDIIQVWSKRTVERASEITIIKPPVKEVTQSPRGNEKEWGAAVKEVSQLNRHTLAFAPAMVASILEYKATELGVPCNIVTDTNSELYEGKDLVKTTQTLRRARRIVRKESEHGLLREIT